MSTKPLPECFQPASNQPSDLYDSGTLALWAAKGCAEAVRLKVDDDTRAVLSYLTTELIDAARQRFDEFVKALKQAADGGAP